MNSKDGFQTNIWGPIAWTFLHMVTLNYDPKRKKDTFLFLKSLKGVLPCGACRNSFSEIINGKDEKLKLNMKKLESRETLSYWLFLVHNAVQRGIYEGTLNKANKPVYKDTKEDYKKAMKKYELMRAKCYKNSHGCTIPDEGIRKRSEIHIVPRTTCIKKRKDPVVIHKKCI